ncbi:hypothetical protein [Jannaschia sp. W003]|uniref:hypothetical protein n=1 Tax=Jannaschia sp. W003 TaxID=2867012 RepID=UPI0021A48FEA|nr:hypothetical protein [Jannaschia sp. W003]UWQ20541.1 hypothetical protein K3554_11155 [Jannaschia sp. W003]
MRADLRAAALLLLASAVAAPAAGDAPRSAIPWLSDSLRAPSAAVPPAASGAAPAAGEPAATAVSGSEIAVMPIGTVRRDAVGLRPAQALGLPRDLFAGSDPVRLAERLSAAPVDALPAAQALVRMLLVAELDPPRAAGDPDALFLARIDALLRRGALDDAQAFLERAGAADRGAFLRWFDVSLLTGDDTRACEAMAANPGIAPTLQARVFCLARAGDWAAAALTLDTGRALGAIAPADELLLAHFLDPESFEGEPPPPTPRPMTPLAYRLLDGIGETPATRGLPLAFSFADLRPNVGWKAQIEAAERLVRAGALDPNRLLALYTERRPSASGGVWDRAEAVQRVDAALLGGDRAALAAALPDAVERLGAADLLLPLATLLGERAARALPGDPHAARLGLLSPGAESVADAAAETHPFAAGVARGEPVDPTTPIERAVADGFARPTPERLERMAREGRLGEALLDVADALRGGTDTPPDELEDAIATLRAAGLPSLARRVALEALLL